MSARPSTLDEIDELLRLVKSGRLFALQDWIKAGKPLRASDAEEGDSSVLNVAVSTGFHSVVEELLRAGGWSSSELADALEAACSSKHFEIAALLESHEAQAKPLDFQTSCENLDLFMMEKHLRAGTDPNENNVFAQVLRSIKARPLLRFYRQFRAEFPALDDQAALALSEAVKERQVRWTALLAWAGADPFRPVPYDPDHSFPPDPEYSTTAAKEALWRKNPDILKALKLTPTPEQAMGLLADAADAGISLFQKFLALIPREKVNDTQRNSSAALERLVKRWAPRNLFREVPAGEGDVENLKCMELMLDLRARWNPQPEELRHVRRTFYGHDPRYVVQVLRLLLYTPNAADLDAFFELCRSQKLEAMIATVDAPFVQELRELRKAHRKANGGDASASKETAAALV